MKHNFDKFKVGNWYYRVDDKRIFKCSNVHNKTVDFIYIDINLFFTLDYLEQYSFYEIESPDTIMAEGDEIVSTWSNKIVPMDKKQHGCKNGKNGYYILKRKEQEKDSKKSLDLSLYDDDYYVIKN